MRIIAELEQQYLIHKQDVYLHNKYLMACKRRGLDPNENKPYLYVDDKGWFRVGILKPIVR